MFYFWKIFFRQIYRKILQSVGLLGKRWSFKELGTLNEKNFLKEKDNKGKKSICLSVIKMQN